LPLHAGDPSPERILEIGYAFRKSKVLLSAVELGVFTALADGPLDRDALIARLAIHERGARDFLDALVALDLLERDGDGRYANRPDCDAYLDRRKPVYVGGQLEHVNARLYGSWGRLTQALRTGAAQSELLGAGGYAALYAEEHAFAAFLKSMTDGSRKSAKELAARFAWNGYRTFIDIGTAQGSVPVEIAEAHPQLTGGGFDLPQLQPAFESYVRQHGLSDRLQFYPGDFLKEPLPSADVLVMGRVLHNWDLETKKMLLAKALQALPQGGALIVYDSLIDDLRRGPTHSLLASLNMLIETDGGFEYSGAECTNWMQEAGFGDVRLQPLGGPHTAVVAMKR
jgi:hypothetical protein